MGMRNPERLPKMYAFLAVYWRISRVAQGRNSSDIIWFCLHFIKKQFTFSNGSCLKDLLFSLVSSSINGSFLLLLNLTTSGSGIVRRVQGWEECVRQLSETCTWCGRRPHEAASGLTYFRHPLSGSLSNFWHVIVIYVFLTHILRVNFMTWTVFLVFQWKEMPLVFLIHIVRSNTDFKALNMWQLICSRNCASFEVLMAIYIISYNHTKLNNFYNSKEYYSKYI